MTESLKYTAKIKARGLDNTGVSEDHARALASQLGKHHMFIVEAVADTLVTDAEGKQQVTLRLTQVEPVPMTAEDTVRDLVKAASRDRRRTAGELTIPGTDDGPSLSQATQQAQAHIERDEDGNVIGVWDGDPDAPLSEQTFPGVKSEEEPQAEEGGGTVSPFQKPGQARG